MRSVHQGDGVADMHASGSGVGALDASEASQLREALFASACEVHHDAASVLGSAPPTNVLRPSPGGIGGDLETHVAVAMFWELRRAARKREEVEVGDGYLNPESTPSQKKKRTSTSYSAVTVRSAYGLEKTVTAVELGKLITEALPADIRQKILVDARVAPGDSGVIHLTTVKHHDQQRSVGNLRCRLCGRFVAGERALWWHSKTKHGILHSEAAAVASNESRSLTRITHQIQVPGGNNMKSLDGNGNIVSPNTFAKKQTRAPSDLAFGLSAARNGNPSVLAHLIQSGKVEALVDPGLDAARAGDYDALRGILLDEKIKWDPKSVRDRHGATALLWASGAGHLDCVKLLCEVSRPDTAPIDPSSSSSHQTGRRAYAGRTALHWAARNGHLSIVKYLVLEKKVDVDCVTGEGTTAFSWAIWRGRLEVARWLVNEAHCVYSAVNTFGCNAAMWVAQGVEEEFSEGIEKSIREKGDDCDEVVSIPSTTPTAQYVKSLGVTFRLLNANGHGVVHKAAQRRNRGMCAFLLGYASIEEEIGEALLVSNNLSSSISSPKARSLVDRNHLRPDAEGFRPSDLARLAGDMELHKWLCAVEQGYDDEEKDDSIKDTTKVTTVKDATKDSSEEKIQKTGGYRRYPPTTFYGAASLGDVSFLKSILTEDVYYVNSDIGAGSILHFAVSYGRCRLVREICHGELGRMLINKKSKAGGFGLTPLHLAASLFTRRETAEKANIELKQAQDELIRLTNTDVDKAAKSDRKKTKKEIHKRIECAQKTLRTKAAGANECALIYRLLLQAGADVESVAWVPRDVSDDVVGVEACGMSDGMSKQSDTNRKQCDSVPLKPRAFGSSVHFTEISALEREVAEAPAAVAWNEMKSNPKGSTDDITESKSTDAAATSSTPPPPTEPEAYGQLVSGVSEAFNLYGDPVREDINEVPGAFVLRNVLGPDACVLLARFVDKFVDDAKKGKGVDTKDASFAPRRESAASRVERLASDTNQVSNFKALSLLFQKTSHDPLSLVSATTTADGVEHTPVEPSRWEVPLGSLAELAKRCRPYLPKSVAKGAPVEGDNDNGHETNHKPGRLAPIGYELNPALRCYRYDPHTASPPHFDKAGGWVAKETHGDGTETEIQTVSAYTVVLYLNGDEHFCEEQGGETTFFCPVVKANRSQTEDEPSQASQTLPTTRSGLTWAVGDGVAPLTEVSARVIGRTGDVLFFPHGNRTKWKKPLGAHESPLHEGSALRGNAKKLIIRTDVFFIDTQ